MSADFTPGNGYVIEVCNIKGAVVHRTAPTSKRHADQMGANYARAYGGVMVVHRRRESESDG